MPLYFVVLFQQSKGWDMDVYLVIQKRERTLDIARNILQHKLHHDNNSRMDGYYSVMQRLCNVHLQRNSDTYCDNQAIYACGIATDESNGQPIAAAIVSYSDNIEGRIHVFVRPEFRSHGIAKQIISVFHTHGLIDEDTLFKGGNVKLSSNQINRKEAQCQN